MADTLSFDQAVSRFAEPPLGALRDALVSDWAAGFGDAGLSRAILDDNRLEARIVSEICSDVGLHRVTEAPAAAHRAVIAALAVHGAEGFAQLVGCALHRLTVMEWVTWNSLEAHLPGVALAQARMALTAVTVEQSLAAGGVQCVEPDLTADRLLANGTLCLGAWRASLPPTVAQRLSLFYADWPLDGPQAGAVIVTAVADRLMEQST